MGSLGRRLSVYSVLFAAGAQRKYFNAWRMHRGNQQESESVKEPEPDAEKAERREEKDSNEGEKSVRVVQRLNCQKSIMF